MIDVHPLRPAALDHIVLRIADLQRTIGFYCEALGCTVDRERPHLGLTHLRAGSAMIDLVTLDGPLGSRGGAGPAAEARNLDHFCLRFEGFDPDRVRAHLAHHGVEIVEEAMNYGATGDGLSLYVRDPEGNTVELKGEPVA